MKLRYSDYRILEEQEERLTKYLESIRNQVLKRAGDILGETLNVHKFHGRIGGRNTTLVDSMRLQFTSPDDFVAQWLKGLINKVEKIEEVQRQKYNGNIYQNTSTHDLVRLVKNPLIYDYISNFLTRNFYREFVARTRAKPDEILWRLWFGDNRLVWGLVIAPAYRRDCWTNDKSEIRRADYFYWTIGHVMETGLIDPTDEKPLKWSNVGQFIDFYKSVLGRLSHPAYEQGIANRYAEYLRDSSNVYEEPFLIPELRYAGLNKNHKYRLDYAALNSHVMKSTGFELSPASTHSSISGITKKTQKELNQELAVQWTKEMHKRNEYFSEFGISVVTFTDEDLQDLNACFSKITRYLSDRAPNRASLVDITSRVERFRID